MKKQLEVEERQNKGGYRYVLQTKRTHQSVISQWKKVKKSQKIVVMNTTLHT